MFFQSVQLQARRDVPDLDRVVGTAARKDLPIKIECDRGNRGSMPVEMAQY
jgi:hypothetical protein